MSATLRRIREARGLSQAELAVAAGVSRQLVGAVEAGRHVPGVTAALALASALGATVEEVFGSHGAAAEPALGSSPPDGTPVMAARVGEVLRYCPLPEPADRWSRADGVYRAGRVDLLGGADISGFAVAGCDPALGLAAQLLPEAGPRRLVAIAASSGKALSALDEGRLHGALVHGIEGRLRPSRTAVRRIQLARWEVGLASPPEAAIDLEALAAGEVRVAQRDAGAEAQGALQRALAGFAEPHIRGPVATGHLDAARRVAYGAVAAGLTMRPAALAYGLGFTPLELHVVELRIAEPWAEHPGARALEDVFTSRELLGRLAAMGGYEL